jgi:hypothetical protein
MLIVSHFWSIAAPVRAPPIAKRGAMAAKAIAKSMIFFIFSSSFIVLK